ncbi:Disease resistance protein (CC-NBS-LRR class) family [Rhynchospora pubera]|uniref:Disease resistance protein (CC-NBS-LRR class) family n=1 Tax=Rhynchospora pubera TaxID=906938 RepID=A0AAV8GX14_9POAL|nr:Disease resistance protein (CC-NBS-LRR class) family [Rhynchospora pubera]
MAGLGAYALISSLINLVATLLPEVKNTFFAPSSSSSAQAPDARAVEADLGRLERMLKRIKATLYDAEERNIQDQSVRLWLKEIRELGHEAEYVLEEYMYEVYRAQVEARKASEQNPIKGGHNLSDVYSVQIPYDMVDRIILIKSRFEEIENDRKALCLREEDAPRRKKVRHTRNPTSPLVEEKSLFGREEEKKKIIDSLLLEGEGFSVLSVVGKGGIGKTTVAQLVYNDKRLKNSFDLSGWVCVSNDFSIERIIQDIIESFTKASCSIKNTSVLMEELGNRVRGKRVFIVLDDVWNEERRLWEPLFMPLMQATKATILVTTRTISVARIIQTMEPVQLEYLSYDKCCLLFIHYAFQGKDPSDQEELVEIGMEIVKKCSGLPLAVKSIASLLSQEKEHASWMEILQSNLWELDAGDEVLGALQISFERLPIYLKPCLLLCSMFPKNHVYSVNLMSRLWIANGYIEPNERESVEEVVADYTKELYERSFFDDFNIKRDEFHLPTPTDTTFKLHDIVHDLALFNSEKTCCSIEGNMKHLRYLCLGGGIVEGISPQSIFSCYSLQTLIIHLERHHMDLHGIENLINLECLEIYQRDPESVGLLKRLRVLEIMGGTNNFELNRNVISDTDLSGLPESICRLTNLKKLIIQTTLKTLPKGFGNLANLQFFFLENLLCHIPLSCGKLIPSCMMNVPNVMTQPDSCLGAVGWLKEFNNLRGALLISDIQNITSIDDVKNAKIISMKNLETLLLFWNEMKNQDYYIRSGCPYVWNVLTSYLRVPKEYLMVNGILGISVGHSKNCKGLHRKDHDILESFQPHPNLKNLSIACYQGCKFPAWVGDTLSCSSLVILWIINCTHITSLPLGNILTLKHLYIHGCESLHHLKWESLPSLLKHLIVRDCNSLSEVALLESLVELEIIGCSMLESLLLVSLIVPKTKSESLEFASDYRHFKSSKKLKRFPSLKKMTIAFCPRIVIREFQLVLEEDCEVHIYFCSILKRQHHEHNYTDPLSELHEEILPTESEGVVADCIKLNYISIIFYSINNIPPFYFHLPIVFIWSLFEM